MPTIKTIYEKARGCGRRKPGGKYLVSFNNVSHPCGRLPVPLDDPCECCGFSIGLPSWPTMIKGSVFYRYECNKPTEMIDDGNGNFFPSDPCALCPLAGDENSIGLEDDVLLLRVGEKTYPTPADFNKEAREQGISRMISQVPKGFELGVTWVALAHKKVIRHFDTDNREVTYSPGIFKLFLPEAMQYVVKDDDSDAKLERLEKQGFDLVRVLPAKEEDTVNELPF